jgi:hypothetical protein
MPRSLAPIVLLLIAAAARADAPKPFRSEMLDFSATFPFAATEQHDNKGGVVAAVDKNGLMYMVGVILQDAPKDKAGIKAVLDGGLAGAAEQVHGKILSQKDIKLLDVYSGREAEMQLQGGHATVRCYQVGPRVYLLVVANKDGQKLPMTAADFFKSFKVGK